MLKLGRNEPCPCGSGKKFKRCHLGREDQIVSDGMGEFSLEMSERITRLPPVFYGRAREIIDNLDIESLTGSSVGIKFIDLMKYRGLKLFGQRSLQNGRDSAGGVVVNTLKTRLSDPDHIYVAISPKIGESTLAHEISHVLDYLAGSRLNPGMARPLALDLGIPVEHLEHPHEFGRWLLYLCGRFGVRLDADDRIIVYLYEQEMLIQGMDIMAQDALILKSKSDRILRFLSEKGPEIDALICELPGYIGSRVGKD